MLTDLTIFGPLPSPPSLPPTGLFVWVLEDFGGFRDRIAPDPCGFGPSSCLVSPLLLLSEPPPSSPPWPPQPLQTPSPLPVPPSCWLPFIHHHPAGSQDAIAPKARVPALSHPTLHHCSPLLTPRALGHDTKAVLATPSSSRSSKRLRAGRTSVPLLRAVFFQLELAVCCRGHIRVLWRRALRVGVAY